MRKILKHRGLRLVFAANMISMLGSGLNAAAVTWYVLKATGSEVNLSYLVALQTVPAMLLLPFSGVVIDREDRRRIVMFLDMSRGIMIAVVAFLALDHRVHLWQLYLMNVLVALGFWMFWPTVTALIQELTPGSEFVDSNTVLMAGVQGGWLIAGAIVGFLYDHIGLGGILVIDVCTYIASFLLYLGVRKGRHVVAHPEHHHVDPTAVNRYFHELREGITFVGTRPAVVALGTSWALFLGGMLTQGVITAPLSDRILGKGAIGYGWLNGAWGIGAFLSALYAAKFIKRFGGRNTVIMGMAGLAIGMFFTPFSQLLVIAVGFFLMMGSARGLLGIALNSNMMELVPKHMMGRAQNTFYFAGMVLQLVLGLSVGIIAHRVSLTLAFLMVGAVYGAAFVLASLPVKQVKEEEPVKAGVN